MRLNEFYYDLPEELIAQYPLEHRAEARLLTLNKNTDEIGHYFFYEIPEFFSNGDVLVLNDTKVYKARLFGKKETGGKVEILILSYQHNECTALINPARRINEKNKIFLDNNFYIEIKQKEKGKFFLKFSAAVEVVMNSLGKMPLPPYIKRLPDFKDENEYQTIYATRPGAIAAPTAGLHFTEEILKNLKEKGVIIVYLTLHIGPGTFKPIRTQNIEEHNMEAEFIEISKESAEIINSEKRIIGVGTSVARILEFVAQKNAGKKYKLSEFSGYADLFIYPGFKFRILDGMVTNFHLPCSTPLLLVCAFAGRDVIFKVYKEAIEQRYRFLSYGDAMLII